MHNIHPKYRPDIDGLRAAAILFVVIFHVFPAKLPGGFIGVDIFFVISGFLISSIIFRSLQRGDFNFIEFYAHRVKRIFPALFVVLVSSYTFGWLVLTPPELKELGKHIAAGVSFVENFLLWNDAGYFDKALELKPMMHLWSLAIEEQFYVIYPLLIWGAWRIGLNILIMVALLGLLSFGLNVQGVGANAVKIFYFPDTRFWELLAGAALAYFNLFERARWNCILDPMFSSSPAALNKVILNLPSLCGLLLISAAAFGLDKFKLFPGWWALAPVAGAFLLIQSSPEAWINRKVLANRAMVFVGLISYPLYLWHWPLLSFARLMGADASSSSVRNIVISLSFFLAWVTYKFVERPIRFGRKSRAKTAALCTLIAAIGVVGYITFKENGLTFRHIENAKSSFARDLNWYGLFEDPTCVEHYGMSPCQVSGPNPDVIILGDSHANHLYPGLAQLDHEHRFLAAGTCAPIEGVFGHMQKNDAANSCATTDFTGKNFSIISGSKAFKTAILSAFWRPLLDGKIVNERERELFGGAGLLESMHPEDRGLTRPQIVLNGLKRTITYLKLHGLKIVFVRGTFDIAPDLSEYCHLHENSVPNNCTIPRSEFVQERVLEDKLVDALKDFYPNLIVIDPINLFCDRVNCFLMRDGILYYRDSHHLSVSGSKLLAETLIKDL